MLFKVQYFFSINSRLPFVQGSITLTNWFKLVYGQFGQSNMHCTFDFGPRPSRKKTNVPQLKSSQGLTVQIYILCLHCYSQFGGKYCLGNAETTTRNTKAHSGALK